LVVYKLDRLSRSLSDFGRLMLNVLLSFAHRRVHPA
jgi:DNA invertase Pin-like site-specific DNA recombinase